VDLIGHSLGGLIAAEFAAEQPQRVHRLALVAPAGIPCGNNVLSRSARLLGTLYDVRGRLPTIAHDAIRAGPFSLIRGALFASHRDLSVELASIQSRTLLIWGEDDRLLPPRIAAEWQKVLPGSRLVRLHCGHVPMWEAPRELVSHFLDFFGEERSDHAGDEVGLGVVHGVRLTRNDDESTAGQ
jgi:pimeloyl-ACP methyl ester carboxylesterase